MKLTKKLAALVLALTMVFSLMAVTAAAYGAEEHEHTDACSVETIQPRRPEYECPRCGEGMVRGAPYYNGEHVLCVDYECPSCGRKMTIPW